MSDYFKIGGLFAPLLFCLLFINSFINAETVEVFISARNSLNNAGMSVKEDILSSSSDKRVIVEFIGLSFSRFYYKYGGMVDSFDISVSDAGDVEALKTFIINANRYADNEKNIIVWDHGNGWYNDIGTFAISYDSNTGHSIGIANGELRSVFDFCKTNYGIIFKTILFDACLMGEIEVADEIKDYCDYMIASPDLVPIDALDYARMINTSDYYSNLINLIQEYNSRNEKKYTVINLKEVGSFISLYKESLEKLDSIGIIGIINNVHYYPDKINNDSIQCGMNSLLNLSGNERAISMFKSMIINYSDTTDISIFLPANIDDYTSRIYEYGTTMFNRDVRWDSSLFSMYMVPDTFPPISNEDTFALIDGNNAYINIHDFYDFYSDVYFNIYNLKEYNLIKMYDFEDNNHPMTSGWIRSSGESYSGDYAYYGTDADTIFLETYGHPVYMSFYVYKYGAEIKIIVYNNGAIKELLLPAIRDLKWNRYAFYDTLSIDSIKIVCESNGGWAFIDNLKYAEFSSKEFLGRKEASTKISLFNLKAGTYNICLQPIDSYNNRGIVSKIVNFEIYQKAKAYIWPTGGDIDRTRHISTDDSTDLMDFSVFSINGKRIAILKNLHNRTFSMPSNAKYGIYYFIAKTDCCKYRGKFAITR